MTDPSKAQSSLTFGAPSTTNTSSFGSQPATAGIFGSTAAKPQASGSSIFSLPSSSSSAISNPFASAASKNSSTSIFGGGSAGQLAPTTSNQGAGNSVLFGGPTTTFSAVSTLSNPSDTSNSTQTVKPGLFGMPSSGSKPFASVGSTTASSQIGVSTPAPGKPLPGLLGNLSTTPAGPPPFNGSVGGASGSGFDFNKPTGPTASAFGSKPAAQSSNPPSNPFFASLQQGRGDAFGTSKSAASAQTAQIQPSINSSGGAPTNSGSDLTARVNPASQPSSILKGLGKQPESFSQPSVGVSAGLSSGTGIQNPSTSQSVSSVFGGGGKGSSAGGTALTSLFPAAPISKPSPPQNITSASNVGTSTLFGGKSLNPPASEGAATGPKTNFFPSLKDKPALTSQSTSTPPFSIAPPISKSTTNPFGVTAKGTEATSVSQGTTQPNTTNATENTGSQPANLGASTSGPRPPPQSRLKNKSMDEIITRWASDLAKYQKEFQKQAGHVANWDRLLVENSDKIQKLYGSTLEAERATVEVERQLTAVENDQTELEYWLDHYERQVDEMISSQVGQGDSLQGPDQERERT